MIILGLRPPPKSLENIFTYLNFNFNRISDALGVQPEIAYGTVTFTGLADVETGLTDIQVVTASLTSVPNSGVTLIRARVLTPGDDVIRLTPYNSAGTYVTTATGTVNWIAVGR